MRILFCRLLPAVLLVVAPAPAASAVPGDVLYDEDFASGSARLRHDMPAWLHYDWNGTGEEDDEATIMFFDVYRTESGLIDRVEIVP